jgi:hypothetical protein
LLLKLITLLGVLVTILGAFNRARDLASGRRPGAGAPQADDFGQCPKCGVWRDTSTRCACDALYVP